MSEMAPPPWTRSSLRGRGRSGADPGRSGKTHPGVLRSAARSRRGRIQVFLLSNGHSTHTLQGKETCGHLQNSLVRFRPSNQGSGGWRDGSVGKVLAMRVPGPKSDHQYTHEKTDMVLSVRPVLGIRDKWTPKATGQSDLIKEPQVPIGDTASQTW